MAATRRRRLLLALVCSVADAEIKGINYGGRFIPEHWLGLPHMRELYEGATPGGDCSPKPCKLSLCDVAASTDGAAGQRMVQYLNRSIQLELRDDEAHGVQLCALAARLLEHGAADGGAGRAK